MVAIVRGGGQQADTGRGYRVGRFRMFHLS